MAMRGKNSKKLSNNIKNMKVREIKSKKQQKKKLSYNEFFKSVAKSKQKLAEIKDSFDNVQSFLEELMRYTILISEQKGAGWQADCYIRMVIDLQSLKHELSIYRNELNKNK